MTPAANCVVCRTRPPRPALTDSRACNMCTAEFDRDLYDLHQLLPVLRALLEPSRLSSGGRGVAAGSGAPLRVDVLDLTEDPINGPTPFLRYWSSIFRTPPTPAGLRNALGRIIEHDNLEAFARALRTLHAEVIRVCGEPGPAKVATCRRDIRGRPCQGDIQAAPGDDTAVCARCGDTWPRSRWKILGGLQTQAG
jgi:hypothetical protein